MLKFLFKFNGLLDPVIWRKVKWITIIARIIKGKMKCKQKNRVKVALSTECPPQTQITNLFPRYGIEEIKLVITEAPQKDIWPQGKTYPKKAVPIIVKNIITPIDQVSLNIKDL